MSVRRFTSSRRSAASVLAIALVASSASQASAAVSFAFAADVANVTLDVGQTAPISIYLVETVTGGDTSVLAAQQGLYSGQVTVAREQATGATIASFAFAPEFTAGRFSATVPASAPYTSVLVSEAIPPDASTGVPGTAAGNVTSVLLATLVVNAANVAGQTSFSLADDPQFSETYTFTGATPLDPLISSGLFTVTTTIPEPAAIAGFAALAWVGRRRR